MNRLRLLCRTVPLMVFAALTAVALPARADVREGDIDGVPYRAEIPANWNGTLLLWSHGAYSPEFPAPSDIELTNHPATKQWLLDHGYALAASQFQGQFSVDYGGMMAAATIVLVPQLIIYAVFQRQVIAGMTVGAIKG